MENVIFFLLGGALSWATSHYYYCKGNTDVPQWFSVEHIKSIISKNPNDYDWTAQELVKLFNSRVYDQNSNDPLPYNFCPDCGSKSLARRSHTSNRDDLYYIINCRDCKWSQWTQ